MYYFHSNPEHLTVFDRPNLSCFDFCKHPRCIIYIFWLHTISTTWKQMPETSDIIFIIDHIREEIHTYKIPTTPPFYCTSVRKISQNLSVDISGLNPWLLQRYGAFKKVRQYRGRIGVMQLWHQQLENLKKSENHCFRKSITSMYKCNHSSKKVWIQWHHWLLNITLN